MDLAALQGKRFRDVIEPHAVGIAVDEKHRRLSGLELVGAKVVRPQIDREDALDEVREFVGRRAKSFVVGFDERAFERFGGEVGECVQPFFCPAILAEHDRNTDDLAHLVRMADRAIQRDTAAEAVADDISLGFEVVEQRGDIVGEVVVGEVAARVGGAPMALNSMAITFRVLESSPIHSVHWELFEIAMNAPWSSTTGSPPPWIS